MTALRERPLFDGPELLGVHADPVRRHDVTQELHAGHTPFTLGERAIELDSSELLKHSTHMPTVRLCCLAEDANVVQVDDHKLAQEWSKSVVEQTLKGCRGVA
jgi:hypothetical protein